LDESSASSRSRLRSKIHRLIAAAFFATLAVVLLSITSVGLHSSHIAYYERYARAIGEGHLWLHQANTCDWDLSPHDGKCYSYWGIVPALFHWALPFVSDRFMTLIAAAVAVFFLLRLCIALSGIGEAEEERAMPLLLFLAFFTGLPATVLAARVYEEAIVFGAAFGLAGLYVGLATRRAVLAMTLLTVAGLARTPWLGVAVLFCLYQLRQKRLLAVVAPVAVGLLVQAWLNHARFGSIFEFGYAAQTSNRQMAASGTPPFSSHNLLGNLFAYLVAALPPLENPLTSTTRAPDLQVLSITRTFMEGRPFQELGLALLPTMPSLLLCIPLWRRGEAPRAALTAALLALPPCLAVFGIAGCIYRYQLEATLPFVLVAVPPLLRTPRWLKWHWAALLLGAPLVAVNALWVAKIVCRDWGYC
jgi:hypothetical protein